MNRFHIIVFSFNRAMQCESVLRSFSEHVKTPHLTVSVLWRATGEHEAGYELLRRMYEPKGVQFVAQAGSMRFFRDVLPRLSMPRNLYHWLKLDYLRKADGFKRDLERMIAESRADFVSFNTDDNIYYRHEHLPDAAFERIRKRPFGASYRVYVGGNLNGCPSGLRRLGELLCWDYLDPEFTSHWAYPFAVDGTFYSRDALLDVIHRVLYHNPVTLESFLVSYVRSQRLFREGISPVLSTMLGLSLNKVSYIVPSNRRGDLAVGTLNSMFMDGYRLEYELPEEVKYASIVPERVIAVRDNHRVVLPVALDLIGT